ncbi:hypothetical protein ACIQF6_14680 [Kitasatospora sp. NPDC092948]|uniref:hypothetical protein n=1 Tax=Kitasatospora sp. NPDC092948 TaxID=3364088 RepID=UPI00380638FE
MIKTMRPAASSPTDDERYTPCGDCHRCLTGVGRDIDPTASDCWGAYLDAVARDLT